MAEEALPSISTGQVGSRFVTEKEVVEARAKRDEAWQAAYARIGQAPPPRPVEDVWDGRSLAEKLAANKAAKQEEWEERSKLSNQFRALEADEVQFLEKIRSAEDEKERKRKLEEGRDLNEFRSAVAAARSTPKEEPKPTPPKETTAAPQPPKPIVIPKKKAGLKGVQVKKKSSAPSKELSASSSKERDDGPDPKRLKTSSSS